MTHLRLPHKCTVSVKLNGDIGAAVLTVPSNDDGPILSHSHSRGGVAFGRSVLPNTLYCKYKHLYDIRIHTYTYEGHHSHVAATGALHQLLKMYPVEDITDYIESNLASDGTHLTLRVREIEIPVA